MSTSKHILIIDVISQFHLESLNDVYDRKIYRPSINRTGLVLAGVFQDENLEKNMVAWGTYEYKFLSSLSDEKRQEALMRVISSKPPIIVLSVGFGEELISEVVQLASEHKVSVARSREHLSTLNANIGSYLSEYFAKTISIHGSAVIVNGVGVVIIGKSGIGKSEAVLELIQEGHTFVTDDTVITSRLGSRYIGKPSPITKDLLEVRGIGLIDIRHTYGSTMVKNKLDIDLFLELVPYDGNADFDRLGNADLKYYLLDGEVPIMQIPVKQGRTISSLVLAAVNAFLVKKDGLDPFRKIEQRLKEVNNV